MLQKKNTYSLDISSRNALTNQVTSKDRISRISDLETNALQAVGAEDSLREFLGARADDSAAKADMYKEINLYGYVSQKDFKSTSKNKQTLNTVSQYLIGAGIDNNLLSSADIENNIE